MRRRSKYGATRSVLVIDSVEVKFDSKKELKRYNELKLLERNSEIESLEIHKKYMLQGAYLKCDQCGAVNRFVNPKSIRECLCGGDMIYNQAITYTPDFVYRRTSDGVIIAEDVKGGTATQTDAFKIKRKMFEFQYTNIVFNIV